MKITDIVKVNIINEPPATSRSFTNREATACVIFHKENANIDDKEWVTYETATKDVTGSENIIKEIKTWATSFVNHGGGIAQAVFKRIYVGDELPEINSLVSDFKNIVLGSAEQEALPTNIIQVQLLWQRGGGVDLAWHDFFTNETLVKALAEQVKGDEDGIDRKILYITCETEPTSATTATNLVWVKSAEDGTSSPAVYESALIMAYLSSILFNDTEEINDVEYTPWVGEVKGVKGYDRSANYNAVVELTLNARERRPLLMGGITTGGTRILTEYFMIVIEQLVTEALARLVLNKIRFSQELYAIIYAEVAAVMDLFTRNRLLDLGFKSPISRVLTRGGINYQVIEIGESLHYGYKLLTLPVTDDDYAQRVYTGAYLYVAIEQQIRSIELKGLVIGGN